jgi:YidC/Oxa1 family membrane protein insertase
LSIPLLDGAVAAVYPFLAQFASALSPVGGAAAAIVLCTVALRALLLPLTIAAVRGERSRAALAPRVAELRRRYAKDQARLATELTGLYRAERVSPLAGCLPALLQAPFFMVSYRLFTTPGLLSAHLLGVPLGARLLSGGYPLAFLPVIAALAALCWLAARRARRVAAANGAPPPAGIAALLPYLSVLSVAVVPLGVTLYLVTTLSWTVVENVVLRRGLAPRPGAAGSAVG